MPHLWQVSPHLYKVCGDEYWVNFHMLVSDNGHAEHVRNTRDCEIWTHERVGDLIEWPTGDLQNLKADRVIRHGEVIRWRGHDLPCDWMPGQTECACCVHGVIDGKRVAFTGDNIFGSSADAAQLFDVIVNVGSG